jgi:DNA polymerase III sliding clamp (beta) subunit (PCNA family)
MEEQLATIPQTESLAIVKRPQKKARVEEVDAIPRPEVEVVSDVELRHQKQTEKKAKKPTKSFVSSTASTNRQVVGADADGEVLFGFLSAAERLVPSSKNLPILSSVKFTYEAGEERMFLEASSATTWTAVAIKVVPQGDAGFSVMAPARHAANAANATRLDLKTTRVGISDGGFWIGNHCIPRGGKVEDFPSRPLLRAWEARAIVPAFYFEEICSRVLTASSKDPTKPGLNGVLLDFLVSKDHVVECTAVGSDGSRLHLMELPQMKIQSRGSAPPPSVMVGEQFFRYLQMVANREWTAMEISEAQVVARGADYQAVADATMKGSTNIKGLENWRSVNISHRGHWAVDGKELERVLRKVAEEGSDESIDLRIDSLHDQLDVWFYNKESRKVRESIGTRRFDGPSAVDVRINGAYLLAAVTACKSGLIQLGFSIGTKEQSHSPVTIRGEDDQFKAIVMPIG